ncbi:hypothetical protein TrCOL_g535 [Triparma columacea]|uniref:Uncharacterized protein n=1 Tax=Triparma columacea TaxID=722753 RepID=A0A9W7GPJ2_9STRA|nr:hypothetical protein TrCOL_g535 [Triparma columacea]
MVDAPPFPHSSTVVTSPEYAHNILHASRVVVIYPAVLDLSSRDPIKAGLDLVRSVPSKLLSPFLTIPPRPTLVVMLEPATQNANTLGLGLLIPFQTLYPNAPTIRATSLQKAALHTIRHALLPPLPHYPQDITILLPHIVILLAFWAAVFVLWKAGSFYVTVLQGMLAELTKEYQVNEEKDKKDKATNDATGTS